MRGSIKKRGSTYSIIVELGRDPITNKRKQKWYSGYKTKKEAEKALTEILRKLDNGEYVEFKETKLKDFLENWLSNKKHNIKPTTYAFYEVIVNKTIVPSIGSIEMSKLKPMHIQSFLNSLLKDRDITNTTLKHYFTTIKTALNQAVKWQVIPNNPCNAIEAPKRGEKKLQVLSPEQAIKLMGYTKTSDFEIMYIPLLLSITCGLRRGEILALKWENVDLDKGIMRITDSSSIRIEGKNYTSSTKTDAGQRPIDLLPFTIPILKVHKNKQKLNMRTCLGGYQDNDLVCCWDDGREVRPDYITHTFKKLLRKCELPDIRFHDLRHTHATLLLLQGVNSKVVSERMGHSSVDITLDIYSHVLPSMQKEAAEKLNDLFIDKLANNQ